MIYDVMRELATQLGGLYVERMDEARTSGEREFWRAEQFRVMSEARAVDPDSRAAIEAHTARIKAELGTLSRRVRFREIKPYAVVESLQELQGPATGQVTLPLTIRWVPGDRTYDVGDIGEALVVYQAVLAEGKVEDIRRFLNAGRLIELWPEMMLDQRIVKLWEGRFSELSGLGWD